MTPHAQGPEFNDGLEVEPELSAAGRVPQISAKLLPFLRSLLKLGIEEAEDPAAGSLGAVQRDVRLLEQVAWVDV